MGQVFVNCLVYVSTVLGTWGNNNKKKTYLDFKEMNHRILAVTGIAVLCSFKIEKTTLFFSNSFLIIRKIIVKITK